MEVFFAVNNTKYKEGNLFYQKGTMSRSDMVMEVCQDKRERRDVMFIRIRLNHPP